MNSPTGKRLQTVLPTLPAKKKSKQKQTTSSSWKDVAREAQVHRDATILEAVGDLDIPEAYGTCVVDVPARVLDEASMRITNLDIQELVDAAATGHYTTEEIVTAFMKRAAVSQKLTNSLTELLGPRAIDRAKSHDDNLRRNRKPSGPLHGVPISVKSHIGVRGRRMPAGYVAWWHKTAPDDALVVDILERAGGVVHARTTEPQSMMQLECASNLWGVTTNPHNTAMSSGGSSGGEAALLALRGSALGVGSDVGGSIRVPAAACGVFGLKPTAFRVPTKGWSSTPPGADPVPTVLGPMCASLEGIELFMRTVLAAEPWRDEPALVPLPWRRVEVAPTAERPLRIGVARHDGIVLPHPPVTRALAKMVALLEMMPHVEVVDFPLYKHDEAWAIASSLYFTDGGAADTAVIAESGEPMLPLVKWILEENSGVKNLTREELEYWLEEREEYRIEYAEAWNKTGTIDEATGRREGVMDALICPVMPGAATRHGTAKFWYYSAVWNLVDYPALAFPAGRVDKLVDMKYARTKFMSEHDKENWALYDPNVFDGMPIGLQIVGRRFDDEKLVAILKLFRQHGVI